MERSLLLLIPTEFEWLSISETLRYKLSGLARVEFCGFGPIAAAASTTRLVMQGGFKEIYLLGIAGSYSSRLRLGQAYYFAQVGSYGIGIGSGQHHRSAFKLGWIPWDSLELSYPSRFTTAIPLTSGFNTPLHLSPKLLSVCSAGVSTTDIAMCLEHHPDAEAEDMEGYAVALACRQFSIQPTIIRGISNSVGERDKNNWQVAAAMNAAAGLFLANVASGENAQ
ncbi:MAG: hypothetical protein KDB03_16135 [Planctomycetales bacterium]|nr:hypothetical protein [Planctomycetales bacterium]